MSARCPSEPISWLRLERYHLGEVDAAERARVAAHLAECPVCAECLTRIERDDAVPLAPLALKPRPPTATPSFAELRAKLRGWRGGAVVASGLAVAAAVVLAAGGAWRGDRLERIAATRVKGGDVVFTLVRDDDARVVGARGVYRDGDRFKAVVTCPPGANVALDLVVFDGPGHGVASFPLSPAARFACGNEVPLPGAFRLTGSEEETVCLVWSAEGESPPDRGEMETGHAVEGERARCKTLAASEGSRP